MKSTSNNNGDSPVTGLFTRFKDFAYNVYEPKLHLLFALLWSISLQAVLTTGQNTQQTQGFGLSNVLVGLTFFLVLFYLRAVDEIKDLDYDRIYNQDRPLVKGGISIKDVWMLIGALGLSVLTLNAFIHPGLAIFLSGTLLYGLGLMVLEKKSATVKNSLLLNLAVTFPVSASLNFYTLYFIATAETGHPNGHYLGAAQIMAIAGYMAAFLHFEFGRKTQWRSVITSGERFYSQPLGNYGAQGLCHLLGLAGIVCVIASTWLATDGTIPLQRWFVVLAVVPSVLGGLKFFKNRNQRIKPRPYYVAYLALFYASNMLMWLD